jgi:hypothetical protein
LHRYCTVIAQTYKINHQQTDKKHPRFSTNYRLKNREYLGVFFVFIKRPFLPLLSDYGSEGWGFESLRDHTQNERVTEFGGPFFLCLLHRYCTRLPKK